jgi:hypothetical protein
LENFGRGVITLVLVINYATKHQLKTILYQPDKLLLALLQNCLAIGCFLSNNLLNGFDTGIMHDIFLNYPKC